MTFEQRIKLIDAGYTKAEIEAMIAGEDPAPDPIPEPEPEQEQMQESEPKQEQKQEPGIATDTIMAKLEELNRAIISANIRNSEQPERESVDEILATVIRPTKKKKEE